MGIFYDHHTTFVKKNSLLSISRLLYVDLN